MRRLIDKNKIQRVVNRIFFRVSAYVSLKTKKKSKVVISEIVRGRLRECPPTRM